MVGIATGAAGPGRYLSSSPSVPSERKGKQSNQAWLKYSPVLT